jgi:putative transposase
MSANAGTRTTLSPTDYWLTPTHKRWGFGLCFLYLRNIKGYGWNHKGVYRIYQQVELNLRVKPKRRIKRYKPNALQAPVCQNHVWSMDFMSDSLAYGRALRAYNVVDDYNREGLGIEVAPSLPSTRVIRSFGQIINGVASLMLCAVTMALNASAWVDERHITLMYTQPGKPTQNAHIERFNRTARHERLYLHLFESVEHA